MHLSIPYLLHETMLKLRKGPFFLPPLASVKKTCCKQFPPLKCKTNSSVICKELPAHPALGNTHHKARALPAVAQHVTYPMQSLGQHFTFRTGTSRGILHNRTELTEEKVQGTETGMRLGTFLV